MYCIRIQGVRNILKRPDVAMCFEWSEKSILYLQQTYNHIVMVFKAGKNVSLLFKNGFKGGKFNFRNIEPYLVTYHWICTNYFEYSGDSICELYVSSRAAR